MKTSKLWFAKTVMVSLGFGLCLAYARAFGQDFEEGLKWRGWVDIGGTFGSSASLHEFAGPATGQMRLTPGFQMDLGFGYRVTPWLQVGPELGMTFNEVDEFGDFSYHNTTLFQMPILATVKLEYPYWGRLVPFAGVGLGGVASFLTFGDDWEWGPDGTGSDFVFGYEAFAGFRFRMTDRMSLGLIYRFLTTDQQNWDVEWWNDQHFHVVADGFKIHSICLLFTGTF